MQRLFLHMPKCAGTSVMRLLEASAPGMVQLDYDAYFRIPRAERNEVLMRDLLQPRPVPRGKVVYGHFFPVRYLGAAGIPDLRMVTVLRDPIERLKSNYRYWKAGDFPGHYLWQRMKQEEWSFEDYAFNGEVRNVYSQFLAHVPLGAFAYIGLYEDLAASVRKCFEALEIPLAGEAALPHANSSAPESAVEIDAATTRALREFHAEDYLIFDFARRKFHGG